MGTSLKFNEVIKNLKSSERPKAILLGNGINNYFQTGQTWVMLLNTIYDKYFKNKNDKKELDYKYFKNYDISYTEFFDLIDSYTFNENEDINKTEVMSKTNIIKRFLQHSIAEWKIDKSFVSKYSNFLNACIESNIPILTTNYDSMLINSNIEIFKRHKKMYKIFENKKLITYQPHFFNKYEGYYYPLNHYYSPNEIVKTDSIESQFGIWHLHGMVNYHQSIRIGQDDYFGLIKKLKNKFYLSKLLKEGNIDAIKHTWLKMFFTSDILIIGLGLDYSDYVIRWLLNQRFKYNLKFNKKLRTYFFYQKGVKVGRRFLFNMLDIDLVNVKYKTMYETLPKKLKSFKN